MLNKKMVKFLSLSGTVKDSEQFRLDKWTVVYRQEVNISVNFDVEYCLQNNHYNWRLCGNLNAYTARRT